MDKTIDTGLSAKQTLSVRLDPEVLEKLNRIKDSTGESISSIVDHALRKYLIDFEEHVYIFMVFKDGASQTNLLRRGQNLFVRSDLLPEEERYPVLTLQIHTMGPLNTGEITANLLNKTMFGQIRAPYLEKIKNKWVLQIDGDGVSDAEINRFLRRASDDVSLLPIKSLSDVAAHKCSRCGISITSVIGFRGPNGFHWQWTCPMGHKSEFGSPFQRK